MYSCIVFSIRGVIMSSYSLKQVELFFVTSLLKRKGLENVFYWFLQYVYVLKQRDEVEKGKGVEKDPFQLLWKVYYDFFALLSPKLELWMVQKNIKYEKLDDSNTRAKLNILLVVVRNLFNCPVNGDVFLLRQYCLHLIHGSDRFVINKISSKKRRKYYDKGKVIRKECKRDKKGVKNEEGSKKDIYGDFIYHMKECHWKALCETLVHMMNSNTTELHDFGFYYSILKAFDVRITEEMAFSLWNKRKIGCLYTNHMHFLLALAVCTQVPDENIVHKKKPKIMLRTCDMEVIDYMMNHMESNPSLPLYDAYVSDAFYDGGGNGKDNVFDWLRKTRVYCSWYDMILPVSKKCGKSKNNKLGFYIG